MHSASKKKGFTLIETIVTLSIFVLVLLIATDVYVMVNRSQRKVAATQKIQDDVRYLMEVMAQDIRLSQINYDFYETKQIDLHPLATTQPVTVLALINQTSQNIFYRWVAASQRVQYCRELTAGLCDLTTGSGWNDLTPNGVSIAEMRFVVTPTANPFTELPVPTVCAAGSEKIGACSTDYGYSCPTVAQCTSLPCYCQYFSDGQHFQPKVRMIIQSVADDPNLPVASRTLNLQSIVSSRLILGQVKNIYHD
jgi:prepilin-type N-terminal cleavage/methylation domain-containing protein